MVLLLLLLGVLGAANPPPRVAMLSAYFGSSERLRDLTFPNKKAYGDKHGKLYNSMQGGGTVKDCA